MKWFIPAKTFLLGEYCALHQGPAIIATTHPAFEVSLIEGKEKNHPFHPDSPAALLCKTFNVCHSHIQWNDPYHNHGGLGASSAQFIGAYLAGHYLAHTEGNQQDLLSSYFLHAWKGKGVKPSGYDIKAQCLAGLVYVSDQRVEILNLKWPFEDYALFLVHTSKKLATHEHLQTLNKNLPVNQMITVVEKAKKAVLTKRGEDFIKCINEYYHILLELNLVAPHSQHLINQFKAHPDVLAIKGCGAMGADVLLIMTKMNKKASALSVIHNLKLKVLAQEDNLFNTPLFLHN